MKKIFTLGCGLLLMSALAVNEAKAAYLPQSTWIYLENYDEEEIADPVEVELTMNSEGEYTITNFLNSKCPFSFTFEKPAIDETSAITITSNHSSSKTSPYLLDENDDYLYCWLENLNGEEGWFMVYAPKIYITEDYSFVYHLNKEKFEYDYYANLTFKGTVYAEDDTEYENPIELGWNNLVFFFNEPEQVESPETPEFPKTIDYTINGEKELAGVDVEINDGEYGPSMSITGESDAETIALTFAVPEGWDGWIISAEWAEVSEQPTVKTRSEEDWASLEYKLNNEGYEKGNTVTFAVEEENNWATLALYKGDKVYYKTVDIKYNVVPAGGAVTTDPVFPESVGVTTYAEGLVEEQTNDEGQITVAITGEIEESTFDVVLDVPEGWDGFISMTQAGDVTVSDSENGVAPKNTRAEEDWMPLEDALEAEGVQGNKFTFKANGERNHVEVYLYKGDQVYVASTITLTANVKKYIDPELAAANQAAYDKVAAEINEVKAEYDEAVEFIKEYNPEFNITEWAEIGKMIEEAAEGAEQALYSANGDGTEFNFAFSAEDYEGMITEMKKEAVAEPNKTAYENVVAEIDGVQEEYETALKALEEEYPAYNMSEWEEIIGGQLNQYKGWAEQAYTSANDNGEAFNFAFDGEEFKYMIDEMNAKVPLYAANQATYEALIAQFDELLKKSDEAAGKIKEMNPDYDMSALDELNAMIEEYKQYALIALKNADEDGEEFFFPFAAEDYEAYIAMEVMMATPAPEYPESFVVTTSCETLNIEQEDFDGVTIITVNGACNEKEFTVTVEVPEGWDGFIGASDTDGGNEPMPLQNKVVKDTEWWFVSDMLAEGMRMTNSFTFPADGEEHSAQLMLVMGEYADVLNHINIEVNVTYDETTGVNINTVDSNATYYDLNGNQIAKPAKGMYVKIVDGKATKVVVK